MLLNLRPAIIKLALHDQHSSGCRALHGSCATLRCSREACRVCDGGRGRVRSRWCCHTERSKQMYHRLVDNNTNSPQDMQCEMRHAFWLDLLRFFLACVWSCSFPSSFTTATSSVNLLPSVYNVASSWNAKLCFLFVRTGTSKATSSGGKLLKSTSSANPDLPSRFPSAGKELGGQGAIRVHVSQQPTSEQPWSASRGVPMERIQTLLVEGGMGREWQL